MRISNWNLQKWQLQTEFSSSNTKLTCSFPGNAVRNKRNLKSIIIYLYRNRTITFNTYFLHITTCTTNQVWCIKRTQFVISLLVITLVATADFANVKFFTFLFAFDNFLYQFNYSRFSKNKSKHNSLTQTAESQINEIQEPPLPVVEDTLNKQCSSTHFSIGWAGNQQIKFTQKEDEDASTPQRRFLLGYFEILAKKENEKYLCFFPAN